jgi:hypothetical protein
MTKALDDLTNLELFAAILAPKTVAISLDVAPITIRGKNERTVFKIKKTLPRIMLSH